MFSFFFFVQRSVDVDGSRVSPSAAQRKAASQRVGNARLTSRSMLVLGAALVMGCSAKTEPPPEPVKLAQAPPGVPGAPRVQPNFPESIGGFRFGIDLARAQKLCGRRLTGTPRAARCATPPVRLDFAEPTLELDFELDKLTGVFVHAISWSVAWRALVDRYAAPNVLVEQVKGRWVRFVRHGTQWTERPVRAAKARHWSAMWALAGGEVYLLQTKGRPFVWYRSAPAE